MRDRAFCFFAFAMLLFTVAVPGGERVLADNADTVFQYSTIDALIKGKCEGEMPAGELLLKGDSGLGTFNALDGEMVVLGGAVYKVRSSGQVVEVGLDEKVPFAAVAFLGAGPAADIKGPLSLKDLCGYLDGTLGEPDIPRIIRIDGTFSHMKTRSVGPGDKRYKGLNEAVKEQAVFEFRNVKGALIGFRFPACAGLVNAPGYHFHFISEDRASGGHVLDMVMEQGTLFAEKKERWEIQFLY